MAIQAPHSTSNIDFVDHPEGRRFNGTIYFFKNLGQKARPHGSEPRDKYLVRIECDTEFMEPDDTGLVRPFATSLFLWASFGHHETRSGSQYPALQELREAVADRALSDDEWYSFDPKPELIGKRVKYRVIYTENKTNPDKPWVNTTVMELLEDQELPEGVELFNEWQCYEIPEKDGGENLCAGEGGPNVRKVREGSAGGPNSSYPTPSGSAPELESVRKYFEDTLRVLLNEGAITDEDYKQWVTFVYESDVQEMGNEFGAFITIAEEKGVDLSGIEGTSPVDDIPF